MATVIEDDNIQLERIETSPFGTNAYITICKATMESVLIDAPGDAGRIQEKLEGTDPKYILITHNHMDHTGALKQLKSSINVPIAIHPSDANYLPCSPDMMLTDGKAVSFGNVELRVLHTPGHTPGSLCFLTARHLISGDTIFPGGPGKTNTPEDFKQIVKSISEKIFVLPDDVLAYPGHGDSTVLKKEKEEFAIFSSRPHAPDLCGHVSWLSA
ncbi:MAG: MBL fold metallo-hydrolase [Candidatus Aminicenantes bacterium]|nr:MAG: MBL fold metallo-hydrolase [Candidatus Aminicenantes bacterium]